MDNKKKLVCGVGINDVDYSIMITVSVTCADGKQKRRVVWRCPFYQRWSKMLERCYSENWHRQKPTYTECSVAEEWKTFSTFRDWMVEQDWEGKQLDKDLLVPGNKVYGPDLCIFVDSKINSFVLESGAIRGDWPIGVCWSKQKKKFQSACKNPFTGKQEHLGYFTCPNEAHKAWLKRKQELAILLAAEQTDERVAKAIIDRYMNYGGTND